MKEVNMQGKQVSFRYVPSDRIAEFLRTNPTRGEVFMDEQGTIYVVDKGDLELYWLRQKRNETKSEGEIEPNQFLEKNVFDLF